MARQKRKRAGCFTYSLGSYPVPDFEQPEGYSCRASDEEDGPDGMFEYEIAVSNDRVVEALSALAGLLPPESYLVLESYPRSSNSRRVYLTDSLVDRADFVAAIRRHARLWRDDGFVSFGAFSYDPPVEVFLNEHKTISVRTSDADEADRLLAAMGLPRLDEMEPYYFLVEHIHSSVVLRDAEGDPIVMRERVEADLFDQFDFYDQTPSGPDPDADVAGEDEEQVELPAVEDQTDEPAIMPSWRCHVHGRLVVVPVGRPRDFHQTFCISAPDEGLAADWVREILREGNARVVRVEEVSPIDPVDPEESPVPPPGHVREGIWFESEREFLGDVS